MKVVTSQLIGRARPAAHLNKKGKTCLRKERGKEKEIRILTKTRKDERIQMVVIDNQTSKKTWERSFELEKERFQRTEQLLRESQRLQLAQSNAMARSHLPYL